MVSWPFVLCVAIAAAAPPPPNTSGADVLDSAALAAASADICHVGVTIEGLGSLGGDYLFGGPMYSKLEASAETYLIRYTSSAANPYLSAADAEKTEGQWALIDAGACGPGWQLPPCRLLAVCVAGCPDAPASNRSAANRWPPTGAFRTQWSVRDGARVGLGEVNATASCCPRKSQRCDACGMGTCGTLLGYLFCPGPGASALQTECCERTELPVFPFQKCDCKRPRTVCDHPSAGARVASGDAAGAAHDVVGGIASGPAHVFLE
mmetsp:Transcript_100638/g.307535  ORF Transcript_100638/g.307535 Transcript_100638/m.307535 type:complete len:265 (-) Transcript_100638:215-1009(-)